MSQHFQKMQKSELVHSPLTRGYKNAFFSLCLCRGTGGVCCGPATLSPALFSHGDMSSTGTGEKGTHASTFREAFLCGREEGKGSTECLCISSLG